MKGSNEKKGRQGQKEKSENGCRHLTSLVISGTIVEVGGKSYESCPTMAS